MYPLLESICIKNGQILHSEWHIKRYTHSIFQYYQQKPQYELFKNITIPYNKGIYKLRILYNLFSKIWEIIPHNPQTINSLKLVESSEENLNYNLKYSNREVLDKLYQQRANCDDILIIKQGLITDSSRHNILLFDGKSWHTPDSPLIYGTCRARLLAQKCIIPRLITPKQLKSNYSHFKLINCMQDFNSSPITPIHNIY